MSKNKYAAESRAAQAEVRKLRMCGRKKAYETKEEATTINQEVYKCPHCKKWHRSAAFHTLVTRAKKRQASQNSKKKKKSKK